MQRLNLSHYWVAATALVVTVGLLLIYHRGFPPEVPLWYSLPWGQDQLAAPVWLWLLPGLIGLMTGVIALGARYLRQDSLLLNLWIIGGMVVQLIIALAVVRIVWLVIF